MLVKLLVYIGGNCFCSLRERELISNKGKWEYGCKKVIWLSDVFVFLFD